MEWTREKTLVLINEYRKRRGLWDMTHDDYRKKDVKQKLLVEVVASLGSNIPIVEIEKKFHTLRTQYHREINRMKRKEPYNSKWFGFKNLQFLSSPRACRSMKGRVKSEITDEGTVTKYIIRELPLTQHDSSGGSANSNEEFLTLHRKPATTCETVVNTGSVTTAASRSHELEKLIEETTKDVEDIEEPKPKVTIKEITVPLEHHTYNAQIHASHEEMQGATLQTSQETHNHHQQQQHTIEEAEDHIETINIQEAEEEIAYQSATNSTGGGGSNSHTQNATVHHITIPARILKSQRRDACPEDDYYEEEHDPHQQQHHIHQQIQQTPQHIQTLSSGGSKRIYYESNGQQHTATILASPVNGTPQPNAHSTLLNSNVKTLLHQPLNRSGVSQLSSTLPHSRDEFMTYGEYVANEMRNIANREVLVALKHKINTALFEAHMAEMQK